MPLRTAARKLPDAVFLPVDKDAYDAASAQVMDTLRSFDVPVEVLGWDEAFLAVRTDDPEAFAQEVRAASWSEPACTARWASATTSCRPRSPLTSASRAGCTGSPPESWVAQMGDRPTDALWGIGRKTARKLAQLGIGTVSELAATETRVLAERLGPTMGPWYRRLGRGVDSSPVDPTPYVARGHGRDHVPGEPDRLGGRGRRGPRARRAGDPGPGR